MNTEYGNSAGVECPVCHGALESTLHISQCVSHEAPEIVEVAPPERRRRQLRCGHEEVEPSAFPLVSAAHEFKTPLVVMLGYTDLLLGGQLGALNQRQKQVLGEMQEGTQRLQKLIQDLLLLQELKAGLGANGTQETANVNQALAEIFDYWSPTATQKRIRFQFAPSNGKHKVRMEPMKLQHVISSLIDNALKHTPTRGRIIVSVTPCFWERRKAQTEFLFNVERKEQRKVENAVRIDVADSGRGIPAEHHDEIFGDFVQLPGGSARGTGLGLAIARRLIEAHGGVIWVESDPGKGSKFSLLLAQVNQEGK